VLNNRRFFGQAVFRTNFGWTLNYSLGIGWISEQYFLKVTPLMCGLGLKLGSFMVQSLSYATKVVVLGLQPEARVKHVKSLWDLPISRTPGMDWMLMR